MKPGIRTCIALTTAVLLILSPASAAEAQGGMDSALDLYSMDLFRGTEYSFELDRTPTRLEGAVMFVRLLGGEEEALREEYSHPFNDVPSWGNPYVGYLYFHELTNGMSSSDYGSEMPLRDMEYITFGLRALGYSDKGVYPDFSWDMSLSFANEVEIISKDLLNDLNFFDFTRGYVADISMELLAADLKGSEIRLIDKLVTDESIPFNSAGVVFAEYEIEKREVPAIGSSLQGYIALNREPVSSFMSRYGFEWKMFGMDYDNYIQIGISDGSVTGILAASAGYGFEKGIEIGMDSGVLDAVYGDTVLSEIRKPVSEYSVVRQILDNSHSRTYITEQGDYITYFLDSYDNNKIVAFMVIEKETEESMLSYFDEPDNSLADDMETQVYHLTNAIRVQKGMELLVYSLAAGETAEGHSKSMAADDYFSHTDSDGKTIGGRAADRGIPYVYIGENLSYGYNDPVRMVNGWLNSKTGHRDTLLGDFEYIGIGVAFNPEDVPLCTQNYWR